MDMHWRNTDYSTDNHCEKLVFKFKKHLYKVLLLQYTKPPASIKKRICGFFYWLLVIRQKIFFFAKIRIEN